MSTRRPRPVFPTDVCPYCCGPSLYLTRAGHDPACPTAQYYPVTTPRSPE